jgi:hypothetical protein
MPPIDVTFAAQDGRCLPCRPGEARTEYREAASVSGCVPVPRGRDPGAFPTTPRARGQAGACASATPPPCRSRRPAPWPALRSTPSKRRAVTPAAERRQERDRQAQARRERAERRRIEAEARRSRHGSTEPGTRLCRRALPHSTATRVATPITVPAVPTIPAGAARCRSRLLKRQRRRAITWQAAVDAEPTVGPPGAGC